MTERTGLSQAAWTFVADHEDDHDRGRSSRSMKTMDESGFVLAAASLMGEFQRVHVVPEIDALPLQHHRAKMHGSGPGSIQLYAYGIEYPEGALR